MSNSALDYYLSLKPGMPSYAEADAKLSLRYVQEYWAAFHWARFDAPAAWQRLIDRNSNPQVRLEDILRGGIE